MKFGTMMHIGPLTVDWPLKFQIFENPRWRRPPSWKSQKSRYISATVWLIFTKFITLMQNWHFNGSDRKKIEFQKSKMANSCHFENRYIILSLQPFDCRKVQIFNFRQSYMAGRCCLANRKNCFNILCNYIMTHYTILTTIPAAWPLTYWPLNHKADHYWQSIYN